MEAKYKLTVEELTLFFEQIESLPSTVKEGEGDEELLDRVTDFQKEAAVLLSQEMTESRLLDICIESGVVLDIELPEISKFKQVIWPCKGYYSLKSIMVIIYTPSLTLKSVHFFAHTVYVQGGAQTIRRLIT